MKNFILTLLLCMWGCLCGAQKLISDQAVTAQQQRMVFKQWDRDKFSPRPGFLGLNPYYLMTWALHPNYPKTDLRPLGPQGPQTQRIGLALAMASAEQQYKLHSDTLKSEALKKASGYSGLLSDLDPLWQLYYKREFSPLLLAEKNSLDGLSEKERQYLVSSGVYQWYREEQQSLLERLNITRKTTLQRGERLLAYQRLLSEYRALEGTWSAKKRHVWKHISIRQRSKAIEQRAEGMSPRTRSDIEIADRILKHSKL
ncbi:hypothetical protein [Pedobacter kyonggii]|uniref:DUF5045 domain-containing protein n=1 Tax=Pedobacter kyonggii TaxID=1926871 RepID=A0A4V2JGV2_9SPHI|nr:hypothetical protein [Pedobacter kyonggii]TBO42217.1 hypothetical protein EYS08_11870 [Pedobacter kyonggii]